MTNSESDAPDLDLELASSFITPMLIQKSAEKLKQNAHSFDFIHLF